MQLFDFYRLIGKFRVNGKIDIRVDFERFQPYLKARHGPPHSLTSTGL